MKLTFGQHWTPTWLGAFWSSQFTLFQLRVSVNAFGSWLKFETNICNFALALEFGKQSDAAVKSIQQAVDKERGRA